MEEDYNLAERYRIVRKHLDRLGYRQALSLDALPLIERLLADLIQTTDSLKHFKTVAQDNIEACSQLQLATEPYKCDNARLVKECNELHLKLLETNESHQKQIKDLKKQVRKLEIDCSDLQLVSSRNIKKIKELETESGAKSNKILELQGKCCKPVISNTNLATKKRACFPLRRPALEADPLPRTGSSSSTLPSSRNVDAHVVDLLGMADHRMNCLNREVTKLKGDLSVQSDNIHTLKSQLATKEKEIMRLKKMLDGGRPLSAVTKDCFCKKAEKTHFGDGGELKILERAKQDLEEQLKDSMTKQHEAMSRALKLAERNEELEKELRDIDHIALAVEADCNSAVQENNRRVSRLQEKVEDLMTQVHVLESELTVERREAQELRADLESCKLEKRNIQRVLESTLDEKKQMTDRINQLTIIEKDLNNTIERLTREISHLESSNNILKDQMYAIGGVGGGGGDEKHKEKGEKNDKNKGKKILKKKTTTAAKPRSTSPVTNKHSFNGHREDEVSKDVINAASATTRNFENQKAENEKDLKIESLKKTIERLETERDYYRNEYNKFREEFNLISNGDNADLWTQACELRRQLNEKEQAMAELQREKKALDREKFNLEARLQTSKSQQRRPCIPCSTCSSCRPAAPCNCSMSTPSGGDAGSTKAMVERLERERDTARGDVDRLAEERDALRERLKIAVDAHTSEQRRLRENLSEAESRSKQLETERQDLMLSQGTRRATINGLEDQLEDLRQELRRTKEELTTQRTQYFQLRALQEQTDQALGDVQGQLGQSETELTKMIDHKRNIEQQQTQLDNQVKELKQECNMLRSNLAQLDQEKDQLLMNLDEKTERIAALEREVRFKEQQGTGLEQQVGDFQHKYQICVDQSAEQERQLRTMEVEINNLQRQLASASMDRENAIRENARIQDDLASVTCECRNLQRELEASRSESYDLKRQLQTYVTEVRRAEELLNRKENERSEMLNHFRSLSLEATVLETNNQSLESEAAEARGALQTAQDRLLDLERQIADRDCLIRGYETQIAELTQNVASMETQLHQQGEQRKRAEADLNAVRDLCVKLDQQKESLEAQLGDKEALKAQCESQLSRLRAEQNMVQDQMSRDNAAVDRLEAMLNQARQESMSNQATNQELQSEMARLKQKISDLQNKLLAETSELRRYQNQAAEYSKQISELRRQMTNERFDRARKEEESRRANSAPKFVKETCPPCSALQGPTPAPRPDPKSVNQWKIPAPSRRIPEERSCGKQDMKKEAQRTNRFNTNYSSHNSAASPSLTPCSHFESSTSSRVVVDDYKTQDKEDVPCINIILKPIVNHKTELKDKDIQIVEVTAVTQNNNRHSVNNTNTAFPNQRQSSYKETENVETKCVTMQTEDVKSIRNISTQTAETLIDQKNIKVSLPKTEAHETTTGNVNVNPQVTDADDYKKNRGVQFRDDGASKNNVDNPEQSSSIVEPRPQIFPKENPSRSKNATGVTDTEDLTITCSSDDRGERKTEQKTLTSTVGDFDSMETLCRFVNRNDKSNRTSDINPRFKEIEQGTQGKLSDRIQQDIDKLETGNNSISTQSSIHVTSLSRGNQQDSIKTQTDLSTCNDTCKDIASQIGLLNTYSDKTNSSRATQNSSTLPSVLSNNPPIPQVLINTTDTVDRESLSKNESYNVAIGTTVFGASFSPNPNYMSCCSNQKLSIRDKFSKTRNDDDKIIACGNLERKNMGTLINPTDTKQFWNTEASTLSNLGIDRNSVQTKSMNTSGHSKKLEPINDSSSISYNKFVEGNVPNSDNCCRSTATQTNSLSLSEPPEYSTKTDSEARDKPKSISSRSNTVNILTASDLTRPEFIRMLTKIKEQTCSLELHLSAMNEAMKRKQATRNRVLHSTAQNYVITGQDPLDYGKQPKKIKTRDASLFSAGELSSIELGKLESREFKNKDLSFCISTCDNLIRENQTQNDEACCGGKQTIIPETENSIVGQNESNISLLKQGSKKPAFKTKRSYVWAPLRQSDYKMWKHKVHKLTPSEKSMIMPKLLLPTCSPNSIEVGSKIDVSCSPTNCCDVPETSFQTVFKTESLSPIYEPRKSDSTLTSNTHSTASNPSVNFRIIRPAVMSSTPNKTIKTSPRIKHRAVTVPEGKNDAKKPQDLHVAQQPPECKSTGTTMESPLDLNTTEYLNEESKCCEDTKMKPDSGAAEQAPELNRPGVRPRLRMKQSSFKSRSKDHSESVPSSASRESFHETLSNVSSKNSGTRRSANKSSPFQFKRVGAIPRLKLMSSRNKNPSHNSVEKDNSQVNIDSLCCDVPNAEKLVSENNLSSHSNQRQFLTPDKMSAKSRDRNKGKDHFAYTIETEQKSPFSRNKFSKFESEEEMSSTDYGKETKDHVNDKKRKRKSESKKLIELNEEESLSDSNDCEVRNWRNDSPSYQYKERNGCKLQSRKDSEYSSNSEKFEEFVYTSSKFNQSNSPQKDSKCTIRVTVSLDDAPSNEEVSQI